MTQMKMEHSKILSFLEDAGEAWENLHETCKEQPAQFVPKYELTNCAPTRWAVY